MLLDRWSGDVLCNEEAIAIRDLEVARDRSERADPFRIQPGEARIEELRLEVASDRHFVLLVEVDPQGGPHDRVVADTPLHRLSRGAVLAEERTNRALELRQVHSSPPFLRPPSSDSYSYRV